jgi:hypothetical protein
MKPRVREHFKGLIKLPETNTTNVAEDLSPAWVEDVFRPVFVELVKKSPRQWWPVVVGNARQGDLKLPPPNLITLIRVKYQQGDWNQCLFKATASALHYCGKSEAGTDSPVSTSRKGNTFFEGQDHDPCARHWRCYCFQSALKEEEDESYIT